jgi:hypothetical protein
VRLLDALHQQRPPSVRTHDGTSILA